MSSQFLVRAHTLRRSLLISFTSRDRLTRLASINVRLVKEINFVTNAYFFATWEPTLCLVLSKLFVQGRFNWRVDLDSDLTAVVTSHVARIYLRNECGRDEVGCGREQGDQDCGLHGRVVVWLGEPLCYLYSTTKEVLSTLHCSDWP